MRLLATLAPALTSLCVVVCLVGWVEHASAKDYTVYIGTYTGEKSQGIYQASFSSDTGRLGAPTLAAKTPSPSFLALHPERPWLYAVGEVSTGPRREGSVTAFAIKADGSLELLNEQPSSGGGPCHLSVDSAGKCVMVANYGSGSIAALPIGADGRLGQAGSVIQHKGSSVNTRRQSGPHAHYITADPQGRFALVCDLGLDKVLVYRLDAAKALLQPNDPPSASVPLGAGPRHLVFDLEGRFVYVVNEMGSSVTSFGYDAKQGKLESLRTLTTLPPAFTAPSSCAEIQLHPSGKFLYASNRGHDSIAVFSVREGALEVIEHVSTAGKIPRHFAIDPSGKWLLAENLESDSIVVFTVDLKTGRLTPTGQSIEVGKPVCAIFRER